MKYCEWCETIKPLTEFAVWKTGISDKCKDCNTIVGEYRRWEYQIPVMEFKQTGCIVCRATEGLHCHHRDSSKRDFRLGNAPSDYEKTKRELKKCEVICQPCHTTYHSEVGLKCKNSRQEIVDIVRASKNRRFRKLGV